VHVVFLASAFPHDAAGGVDMVHVRRATELARRTALVAVVPTPWAPPPLAALHARWRRYRATPRTARFDDLTVLYPRYLQVPGAGPWAGAAMAAGAWPALRRLRADGRCDVVFAQAVLPDGLAATLCGRRLGVPVACLGRGTDVHGLAHASRAARRLAAWTVRHAAAVGVVAHELGPMLARLQPRRPPTVLQNGIDLERFAPGDRAAARRRLGLPWRAPIVLYVGRLDAAKGVLVLCDAVARLAASQPDVVCALAGAGPLEPVLQARAADPALRGRLRLAGEIPHADVPTWMAAADVVVLPSAAEGCPNVVREALACGRPVVATPVGDVPRLLSADAGRLVRTGDAGALAEGIAVALRTPWEPARLRARVADMTWARNAEATHRFLAAAVEQA